MNKGLPASSGVHGLRAGFSEVGPDGVIILTLGLDDLLLFLLSWNYKRKQNKITRKVNRRFFQKFILKNIIQKKNTCEETWTYNPSKYLPPQAFTLMSLQTVW